MRRQFHSSQYHFQNKHPWTAHEPLYYRIQDMYQSEETPDIQGRWKQSGFGLTNIFMACYIVHMLALSKIMVLNLSISRQK